MYAHLIHRFVNKTRIIYSPQAYFKSTSPAQKLVQSKVTANLLLLQINEEKQNFQDAWQDIICAIKTNRNFTEMPTICDWVQQVFTYNTTDNYKARGLAAVFAYKIIEKPENITDEKLKLMRITGWLVEVLQAYIFMLDDIIDGSTNRRGKPCWYRKPDVGLSAVTDTTLMYTTVFEILKKYFGNTKYYPTISDTINEHMLRIAMGLSLEYKTAHKEGRDFSLFTNDRYDLIVKYKTSVCGSYLPIYLAMFLTEDKDVLPYKNVEEICYELGRFLQIQNDVLDCYGNEKYGKIGTDIQEGRCTWLSVQAYQRSDQKQRTEFEKHFGKQEPDDVERIKLLYEELHLLDLFREEEDRVYMRLLEQIRALPKRVSPSIFYQYLDVYEQKTLVLRERQFLISNKYRNLFI